MLLCGHTPRDSIEVRRDDGEPIVVPGPVHTDPAEVDGPVDVVLLAVKDTQNEDAAGWLARLCDERTVVCALQNGVEQVERVGRLCPSSHRGARRGVDLGGTAAGGLGAAAHRGTTGAAGHRRRTTARRTARRHRHDRRPGPGHSSPRRGTNCWSMRSSGSWS